MGQKGRTGCAKGSVSCSVSELTTSSDTEGSMSSIRKRQWVTSKGEPKEAWLVDYVVQHGKRHIKTFKKKKDADAAANRIGVDVRAGTHSPDSTSITVAEAAAIWLKECAHLERGTLAQYRSHVDHIAPRLGWVKLAKLSKPGVHAFVTALLDDGMSAVTARKVLTSLRSILEAAHDAGYVAQNVALSVKHKALKAAKRRERKLQVGIDIPSTDEIRRLLAGAGDRLRPVLMVAVFTGLRASELRGLRWGDVDLDGATISVRQRADRYQVLGMPKSYAGHGRVIPLPVPVVNTLRTWKLK
jgi:integrase